VVKTEILCGVHSVYEAFAAGRRSLFELFVAEEKTAPRGDALLAQARLRGIPVSRVPAERLSALAGTNHHQGVAARVSAFVCRELFEPPPSAGGPQASLWLALDSVQDPHNLGAILRTALCAGADAVIVPKDRSAAPTPAVSRISAGALEHVPLIQVTNLARTLGGLKKAGLWAIGLERDAPGAVFEADLTVPLVLVIGGEGKGMRPLVKRSCELRVSIPQKGPLDSLNASAAAAVALFEILRQRRFGTAHGAGAGAPARP
jgi:23S rRNA (guanosine2251-2'-O)-methyltransferase